MPIIWMFKPNISVQNQGGAAGSASLPSMAAAAMRACSLALCHDSRRTALPNSGCICVVQSPAA